MKTPKSLLQVIAAFFAALMFSSCYHSSCAQPALYPRTPMTQASAGGGWFYAWFTEVRCTVTRTVNGRKVCVVSRGDVMTRRNRSGRGEMCIASGPAAGVQVFSQAQTVPVYHAPAVRAQNAPPFMANQPVFGHPAFGGGMYPVQGGMYGMPSYHHPGMPSYNGGIFNLPPYQGPYRQQPIRTVPNDPSYGHVYGPNGPNVIRNYNNVIQVPVQ